MGHLDSLEIFRGGGKRRGLDQGMRKVSGMDRF